MAERTNIYGACFGPLHRGAESARGRWKPGNSGHYAFGRGDARKQEKTDGGGVFVRNKDRLGGGAAGPASWVYSLLSLLAQSIIPRTFCFAVEGGEARKIVGGLRSGKSRGGTVNNNTTQ